MVSAKFGSKEFKVTEKTIYTPSDTTIGESIDIEETERSEKKPSTAVKGIKLQTLSFSVLLDARFVTIDTELRWWKSTLLAKQSKDFYLGNYKIGRFYLVQYGLSEINMNKQGEYTKAKLTLSFTEDGTYAGSNNINFEKVVVPNSSADSVKDSVSSSTTAKDFRIGSVVKPKSGTRWYITAEGAIRKKGTSGKAWEQNFNVTITYKSPIEAIHLGSSGWMRPEDVTLIKY